MKALKTDLYQITMLAGYFATEQADRMAVCEMFVRTLPKNRDFLVVAGMDRVIDYIENLRFEAEEIAYLRTLPALASMWTPEFEEYLRDFRFTGTVRALPEGSVAFANEPIIQIEAPLAQAQLVETYVLSVLNHGMMVASKAAKVVAAAQGKGVLEFGSRRTHDEAAVDAARACFIAGCIGTSNVEAGMRYGIPVVGTAAHMWTMAHDSEEEAFANYCKVFPGFATLLIDTYDTVQGARNAIKAAGKNLKGVRIDSGDLLALSKEVRALLDSEGLTETKVIVSNDMNEDKIAALLAAGAPIDVFGVGTEMVCSKDAPSVGGVYKLVEIERNGERVGCAKFSEGKATMPHAKQVWREPKHRAGLPGFDVIGMVSEEDERGEGRLKTMVLFGQRLAYWTLSDARAVCAREVAEIGSTHRVHVSEALFAATEEMRAKVLDNR